MTETVERKRDIVKRKLKGLTEKEILTSIRDTLDGGYDLFKKKLHDYGINIFKLSGGKGIIMKIREKYARFDNLMRITGDPECEPVVDTIRDLAWYCVTLLSMIAEEVVDVEELKEWYVLTFDEDELNEG